MNWLRRNWVDALMGVLIVTVLGGVLALLLRGGGFGAANNPASATQPVPQPVAKPAPVAPPAPQASSAPPAPSSTPTKPSAQTNPPAFASPQPPRKPLEVPAIPSVGETQPSSSSPALTASRPNAPIEATTPTVARAQTAAPSSEPRNSNRTDFLKNYRVAVGTYSNAARSQSAAQKLRTNGFPAQAFSSGAAFIVVVGPYAKESSARVAFNKLRAQGFPDAVLYAPNGKRERGATGAAPQPAPSIPTVASSKPLPTGGGGSSPAKLDPGYLSYLQVGAFKDTKSALPLLLQLKGSGFKALLRAAMDGLVRVLVGPYDGNSIEAAKESLQGQGLTPFAVQQ